MSVPIQPMPDFVVVQAVESPAKPASGIILPESAQEKPKTAKVVAVGKDVDQVKVGDNVIYQNEYESTKVNVGKDEYTLISKKNIVATVK